MDDPDPHDLPWRQNYELVLRPTERLTVASMVSTGKTRRKTRKRKNRKSKKIANKVTLLPSSLTSTFPVGFFNDEKGIGCQLFESRIRSFLTVRDLGACAMTCRALSKLCPTFTVQELLCEQQLIKHTSHSRRKKLRVLNRKQQQMALGSLVMRLVTTYHTEQERPTRWVIPQGETKKCQDKVYHPEELPKVELLMNEFFQGFKHNKIDNGSQSMSSWSYSFILSYCLRTFYPDATASISMFARFKYRSESISFSSNWVLVSAFFDTLDRLLH